MLQCQYEAHISKNDTYSTDKPHFHEDIEIVLCIAGEGVFFIGSEGFPLFRGQLFLIDSSVLHRSVANEEYRCIAFHIAPDMLQEFSTRQTNFAARIATCGRVATLNEQQSRELEDYYKELSTPCGDQFGDDMKRMLVVLNFLQTCFSHFVQGAPAEGHTNPSLDKVSPILEYIQEHLEEPITVESIAEAFFMSKYYLCHIFKEGTGFSLMDYVINCRILKARALLRQGVRLQEAGERAGFRSNEHFIRTFKKLTGTTPKRYGMMYREIDQKMKQEVVAVESADGRLVQSLKV